MPKDRQELIAENIGYSADKLGSSCKRCERGLEPSEARVTGVPRALLRPDPFHEKTRPALELGSQELAIDWTVVVIFGG